MLYGTLGSLTATKINELIAYSSIIHMGYMLLPFITITTTNFAFIQAICFSYLVYYTLTVAAFLFTCSLAPKQLIFLTDLNYKFSTPIYAGFIVSLLSLAGLPPTVGFLAK